MSVATAPGGPKPHRVTLWQPGSVLLLCVGGFVQSMLAELPSTRPPGLIAGDPKVLNFFFLRKVLKSSVSGVLNGPLLPGNLSKKVGGFPPHLFR